MELYQLKIFVTVAKTGAVTKASEQLYLSQPAVSAHNSPFKSVMTLLAPHDSSVGTTRPTPLPERVGANASTCSGPSWRR